MKSEAINRNNRPALSNNGVTPRSGCFPRRGGKQPILRILFFESDKGLEQHETLNEIPWLCLPMGTVNCWYMGFSVHNPLHF